jgi:gas vesicle protein
MPIEKPVGNINADVVDFSPEDIWTEGIDIDIPDVSYTPTTDYNKLDIQASYNGISNRYNISLLKNNAEVLSIIYSKSVANRDLKIKYDEASSLKIREVFASFGSAYTPTAYVLDNNTLVILPLNKGQDKQSSIKRQKTSEWAASTGATYKGILDVSRNANVPEKIVSLLSEPRTAGQDKTLYEETNDIKHRILNNTHKYLADIKSYTGPYTYNIMTAYLTSIENDIDNVVYTYKQKILADHTDDIKGYTNEQKTLLKRAGYKNEGGKLKQINILKVDSDNVVKIMIPYDEALKPGSEVKLFIDRYLYQILYNGDFVLKGNEYVQNSPDRSYIDKAVLEMKNGDIYNSLLIYNTYIMNSDSNGDALSLILSALSALPGLGFFRTGAGVVREENGGRDGAGLATLYALKNIERIAKDKEELSKYAPNTGKSLKYKILYDLKKEAPRASIKEQRVGGIHGLKGEGGNGLLIRNLITSAKGNETSLQEEILKRAVLEELKRTDKRRKELGLAELSDDDYDYLYNVIENEARTYSAYDEAEAAAKQEIEKDVIANNPIYNKEKAGALIELLSPAEELMERIKSSSYPVFSSVKKRIDNLNKESGEQQVSLDYTTDEGFNMADVVPDTRQGIRSENKLSNIKKDVMSIIDSYNEQIEEAISVVESHGKQLRTAIRNINVKAATSSDRTKDAADVEQLRLMRAAMDADAQCADVLRGILMPMSVAEEEKGSYIKYSDTLLMSTVLYKAKLGYDIDTVLKDLLTNQKFMSLVLVMNTDGLKRKMQTMGDSIRKAVDGASKCLNTDARKIFTNYQIVKNIISLAGLDIADSNRIVFESEINTTTGGDMDKQLTVHNGFLYEQVGVVGSPEAGQALAAQQAADSARLSQIDAEIAKVQATLQTLDVQKKQIIARTPAVTTVSGTTGAATPIVRNPQGVTAAAAATPSSQYDIPQQGFTQAIHECDKPLMKVKDKVYKVVGKNV